jgi:hypothetical protein
MDPRAITLAQLDFEELNEHVRVRGRSRMHDRRQRHLAFPKVLTGTIVRIHTSARSWIGVLRLDWVGRLGRQST